MTTGLDSRVRVLHVVPDLGVGGAERHVATLMPRLDPQHFVPSVICIGQPGALFDDLRSTGIPVRAMRFGKRQALPALLGLISEFRRNRPDVVLVRGYNAEMLGRIAAWITRVPVSVVWVHNDGDIEPRGRVRIVADAILDRVTDAYFGVAQRQRDYIVNELGRPAEKVTIIHNGVDPAAFDQHRDRSVARDLGVADSEPLVGIIAALRPEKDHQLFLAAAAQVRARIPNARFLIVGDGPMRDRLHELAAAHHLDDAVIFTGARSDVPAVLRSLDLFVLCSYSIECFPMALLEAMACAVPAVCTDVGGVSELVDEGRTGHLVPPHDASALARQIVSTLSDRPRLAEMGRNARTRVETEFSLDGAVESTQRHLQRLVATRGPCEPITLTVVLDVAEVGGVELLLLDLFSHFDTSVIRPRVVCLRGEGALTQRFRDAGFEVAVIDRTGRWDPRRLTRLVADLRRSRTDVVLVTHHHRAALAFGRVAARIRRVPNIVAAHDMDLTDVGGRVLPRWAVDTLWASQALVLLSRAQGRYLHDQEGVGTSAISRTWEVVIPNGIVIPPPVGDNEREWARADLGIKPEDFAIGMVARLSSQKAHEVAFHAMSRLVRTHPNARLFVIGQGDREKELRFLASSLGLEEHIAFTGVRSDVANLLPAFDAGCLSSVHEGVPLAVIEYMAAGLPVVATDCGSLSDMVTDGVNGYLVDVGDADSMAERLSALAAHPELRRRLGSAGRRRAENDYQITKTAHDYQDLVSALARRRARS